MINLFTFAEYPNATTPKRLMKYVLIWCSRGTATVIVDDKELTLKQHQVLTITSGQVHYFKKSTTAQGVILEFTLDFFCKDDNDLELIFHNGLFCHFDLNEIISVPNYALLEKQFALIHDELLLQPYQYRISIHSRIKLILIEINRTKVERGDEIYKPDALFLKFLESVRANFKNNYSVKHHARLLHTTEAKLNEHAKLHTGKTAQNVIYGLIVSEAKRSLRYQKLPVKETAFTLGFNDPFYFSNFFKKHTGQSPKTYQQTYNL
ncbi:MAG: helix-turn-helix transcriptional regulator [Bacteroidota bacterium]